MIKASVIGASGYTGIELIRILATHPNVEVAYLVSETYQNQKIAEVFPHLTALINKTFTSLDVDNIVAGSDVVFLALPHTASAPIAKKLLAAADGI